MSFFAMPGFSFSDPGRRVGVGATAFLRSLDCPGKRNSALPSSAFIAESDRYKLLFMDERYRLSPPQIQRRHAKDRRNTMNASKMIIAVAAVVVAGSAFASDVPAAGAAVTSA